MAQFPCLPLWTDAWIADTHSLTRAERGTYLDLLVLMWRTPGCKVPNDDAWLTKKMVMTAEEVANELRPLIVEFCQTDGNWIYQKRLRDEFIKRFEWGKVQSARRKGKKNKQKHTNPEQTTNGLPPSLPLTPKDTSSSFPTAAKEAEPSKPPSDLATALPAGALARSANGRANGIQVSESLADSVKRKGWIS